MVPTWNYHECEGCFCFTSRKEEVIVASVERRSGARGDVYLVRFRDELGKQRKKTFPSYREARDYGARVEGEKVVGDYISPDRGKVTFGEWHARWTDARAVSPSREMTERSQAKNHILPTWGKVPLNRISPLKVEKWLKDSPAGPHTKVMVLAQFKQCLEAAVREQLIRGNPAASVKAPTIRRKPVTKDDVLNADELNRLVAAMPERWQAFVYLGGWIGWRWSEAMGLQQRHVNWDEGTLELGARTVVESKGILHERGHGKTDAATRVIPLPGPALTALRRHVDAGFSQPGPYGSLFVTAPCPPQGRHATVGRKGGCQVGTNDCFGHTPFRSNFRRDFNRAVKEAGLGGRGINMRQLRHTGATLMLAAGLDLIDVQQRLGHARGSTTLDIYSRVLATRRTLGNELMSTAMGESQ